MPAYYPEVHALVLHASPTRPATAVDEHQPQACPACGHDAVQAGAVGVVDTVTEIIRAVLNRAQAPESCHALEYDSSGLAPAPCGCRDVFHRA